MREDNAIGQLLGIFCVKVKKKYDLYIYSLNLISHFMPIFMSHGNLLNMINVNLTHAQKLQFYKKKMHVGGCLCFTMLKCSGLIALMPYPMLSFRKSSKG